jgi:hypothetical protein
MAKKKNAPVLRSGNEPETKTITKSYAVRDKWLDKAKDNLVEFKSVDGEVQDLTVNGQPAGGGGGDITSATLTISSPSTFSQGIFGLFAINEQLTEFNGSIYTDEFTTVYPILVGGKGVFVYDYNVRPTVSGNIQVQPTEQQNKFYLIITGDCSITVSE